MSPTTGVGVSAKIAADTNNVTLSLSGTSTHRINPSLQDAAKTVKTGTVFTLTAAAAAVGGTTTYTGTFASGGSNALAGEEIQIAGFVNGANNGNFPATASTTTTVTVANTAGVSETHAGTATVEGNVPFKFISRNPAVATVSSTGLITAVSKGGCVVEVAYPTFDNTLGNGPDGLPLNKVYSEINVQVNL